MIQKTKKLLLGVFIACIVSFVLLWSPSHTQSAGPARPTKYYVADRVRNNADFATLAAWGINAAVVNIYTSGSTSEWQSVYNAATAAGVKIVIWPNIGSDNACGWESPFNNPVNGSYIESVKPLLDWWKDKAIGIVTAHEPMWHNCNDKWKDMKAVHQQIDAYTGGSLKTWVYIGNISDMPLIDDYTNQPYSDIMDVAIIWLHCAGGAEGPCEGSGSTALSRITGNRQLLTSTGSPVELVFVIQTFTMGGSYGTKFTLSQLEQYSCDFLNTSALDGFGYYTWDEGWYSANLKSMTELQPGVKYVYDNCINQSGSTPMPTPTPGSGTPTPTSPRTPTPTRTPTPVSGCNQSCDMTISPEIACGQGLLCSMGFCRNPNCLDKIACVCVIPTPTPTPKGTPIPSSTPSVRTGDANGDGKVDEADYEILRAHFGQTVSGGKTVGDFDGNGVVDGVDYVIWLNTLTGSVATPTPTQTRTPTPGGNATPTPTRTPTPTSGGTLNWYKGNTHSHSENSDGTGTPQYVSQWYKSHGYTFNFVTDHNTYATAVVYENLTDPTFLAIGGLELNNASHITGLGVSKVLSGNSLQAEINSVNGNGGTPVINHPTDDGLSAAGILATTGVQHMEICNMERSQDCDSDTAKWDAVLSTGRVMYGIASDDSHWASETPGTGDAGRGWIVVRASALTKADVLNAIKNGNFYASTGIVLNDYSVNNSTKTISVDTQNGSTVAFIGKNGAALKTVQGSQASYQFSGSELYVRAYVTNASGQRAWTQPVFYSGL